MTGLMQRILRRRSGSPEQADEEPTRAHEQPTGQFPAGLPDDETAPPPPSFRDRGRLRRRLRYLRRARELGFRDLGGLVFDLQRFGRDRPDLVQAKLDALAGVDRELRALESALDERRPIHELREPGIASCPRCGALHGTDARFCPACGAALRDSRAVDDSGGGGGAQRPVGEIGTLQAGAGDGGAVKSREGAEAGAAAAPWETGEAWRTEPEDAPAPDAERERWPGTSP